MATVGDFMRVIEQVDSFQSRYIDLYNNVRAAIWQEFNIPDRIRIVERDKLKERERKLRRHQLLGPKAEHSFRELEDWLKGQCFPLK